VTPKPRHALMEQALIDMRKLYNSLQKGRGHGRDFYKRWPDTYPGSLLADFDALAIKYFGYSQRLLYNMKSLQILTECQEALEDERLKYQVYLKFLGD